MEVCLAILRDYPDFIDAYTQLAGNLRRLGRFGEARNAYREAIRRSPSMVDSLALEMARVELDLGNLEAAALNAQQAMTLNPDGEPGYFETELFVYGRAGAPCKVCGTPLRAADWGQRATVYCPRCQR